MNEYHSAMGRLWVAVEALALSASPIEDRVVNAWAAIGVIADGDFAEGEERDLFASIRTRMKVPTEAQPLDVARDIFRLFRLAVSSETRPMG